MANELKRRAEQRLSGMHSERSSFDGHWREIANFILPRRYRWLHSSASRGSAINAQILDGTATIAARNLAAGMMSGITSPTRSWFKLRIEGQDTESSNPVSLWLSEAERRMMRVFQESNFYNALATAYLDLVTFGTAPIIIYEDYEDIIRCYNSAAGEYYIASSDRLTVETFAREFSLTIAQTAQWFGKEKLSQASRTMFDRGREALATEITIGHLVERNAKSQGGPASSFPFREVYWEVGQGDDTEPLLVKGFHEFPVVCPRWDLIGNDSYGRSPAMDALPDVKQLQLETKRKAQAIDKLVNPPMVADVQLRNQPASFLPGGVTYVSGMDNSRVGIRPAYQVAPPINELMMDIQQVQDRIRTIFHNDLLLTISNLQTVRTATEVDARREEKLIMIGPVVQRLEDELLSPAINRTFNIMLRLGLFPDPPQELAEREINVDYVSMFALAQRATASAGMERLLAVAGNIAAGQASAGQQPDAFDKLDVDAFIDEYGSQMSVPPKLIRDAEAVAAMRQGRQEAMAQEKAMAEAGAMVQGAQTLSQTDVGGGINALQAMTGM